jgi:hypothetical protein
MMQDRQTDCHLSKDAKVLILCAVATSRSVGRHQPIKQASANDHSDNTIKKKEEKNNNKAKQHNYVV